MTSLTVGFRNSLVYVALVATVVLGLLLLLLFLLWTILQLALRSSDDQTGKSRPTSQDGRKQEGSATLSMTIGRCGIYLLLFLLVLFLVIPYLFKNWSIMHRKILFANYPHDEVELQFREIEFSAIQKFQLTHPKPSDNITIDAWYIPPQIEKEALSKYDSFSVNHSEPRKTMSSECSISASSILSSKEEMSHSAWFVDDRPVVLYAHGMGANRGTLSRLSLYKRIRQELKYYVIAFDYRNFGDSSATVEPTADGLTDDTRLLYNWLIHSGVSPARIILWGHSLGTAVLLRLLASLPSSKSPLGAVLEAPFTSLAELIPTVPVLRCLRFLPCFDYFFVWPFTRNGDLNFASLPLLIDVHCPLLILHSRSDDVIPFWHGLKLFRAAQKLQPHEMAHRTSFHDFSAEKHYNHLGIVKAPELCTIIEQFIQSNVPSKQPA